MIEPPEGPALKLPQGSLFNTVQAARACLLKLAAWGRSEGEWQVTMTEAGFLLGLNRDQAVMLLGEGNHAPLTRVWRYAEWVRVDDVLRDVCRERGGRHERRTRKVLAGLVWQVPWRGGAYCARYEDVLMWRKVNRLEALAGPTVMREIGPEMVMAWAKLPAAEAAVMVTEAAGWALFEVRSRGGRNRRSRG